MMRASARLVDIETGEALVLRSGDEFEYVNAQTIVVDEAMTVDAIDEDGEGIIYVRVVRANIEEGTDMKIEHMAVDDDSSAPTPRALVEQALVNEYLAPAPPMPRRKRRWGWIAVIAVIAIAQIVATVFMLLRLSDQSRQLEQGRADATQMRFEATQASERLAQCDRAITFAEDVMLLNADALETSLALNGSILDMVLAQGDLRSLSNDLSRITPKYQSARDACRASAEALL